MPAPIAAAAMVAARLAARQIAKNAAKTTIKKGTKSTKGQGMSTGKAKIDAAKKSSTKKYEAPVKGSGKPKYQNVIKEARLQPKKAVQSTTTLMGRKRSAQEISRKAEKKPNLAQQIDREYKIQKGVRTAKSTGSKIPVKKSK